MTGMEKKKIPELLVPANNLNVLKYAIEYGADAVYAGGKKFNLRSIRGNFSLPDMEKGIDYTHKKGKKFYLTLNAVVHEDEMEELTEYIDSLKGFKLDAIIISDLGVISLVKEKLPGINIHISTQANITNHAAVETAYNLGASRVNLSRELSYNSLKEILKNSDIELEVFAHGALCISYSGRCMLSKYMSGRDANKGECAHSCRWKYYLMEEERPNLFFPVEQDNKGTYIYNSRDLCLLPVLDRVVESGVSSIKIEGRMKTENYVSLVTWVYRRALDLIKEGNFNKSAAGMLMAELDKASHRNFTTGFMFSGDRRELEDNDGVGYIRKYRFIGTVEDIAGDSGEAIIAVRNQFMTGDELDILQPGKDPVKKMAKEIIMIPDMNSVPTANPNDRVLLGGLGKVDPYSILRIKTQD